MDNLNEAEELLDWFQKKIWDPIPAAFINDRGLEHGTVSRFGLGYTAGWGETEHGDYTQCLVIPYEDGMGNLRKVRFRPLINPGAKRPKYLTTPGSKAHLFAVRALDNAVVYVTEGEIDAMILWQLGYKAVGIPGANTFKPTWRHLFREPHVGRVVLVLDPDAAGISAAKRLHEILSDVTDVTVVNLPKGCDVNDTFLQHGADKLREALDV